MRLSNWSQPWQSLWRSGRFQVSGVRYQFPEINLTPDTRYLAILLPLTSAVRSFTVAKHRAFRRATQPQRIAASMEAPFVQRFASRVNRSSRAYQFLPANKS